MIEPSAFDSDVFGLRVGKSGVAGLTADGLRDIRQAAVGVFDIVFVRDRNPRLQDLHTLEWTGLELADLKAVLTRSLRSGALPGAGPAAREFTVDEEPRPDDSDALASVVERIADRSRFVRAFGADAARRLYRRWLEHSLAGHAADACFVARERGQREPAGLITVKCLALSAELVLVATGARHEGRGVGRLLTSHALSSLKKRGMAECSVGTQWTNRAALRFYSSMGFEFDSMTADFHLRPVPPAPSPGRVA